MELLNTCPYCKSNVTSTDLFCPNCGNKLKEKPVSTSLLTQILIYSLSIFLPPLGLWPGIKYLRRPDHKSKTIGWAAIILTIVSTVLTVYICVAMLNAYGKYLNNQTQVYENLNF